MFEVILLIHVVLAVALVIFILLQQGKGADMGAAFGSGSSNTVFGSQGPASFLMKLTGGLMALFFVTSLVLGHLSASRRTSSVLGEIPVHAIQPAASVNVPTAMKVAATSASASTSTSTVPALPVSETTVPRSETTGSISQTTVPRSETTVLGSGTMSSKSGKTTPQPGASRQT